MYEFTYVHYILHSLLQIVFYGGLNLLLAPLGVIWTPAATVICGVIARKRGLNPIRYAMIGGVYSALLFFPWLYLLLRMLERRVPQNLVVVFYASVLLGWLASMPVGTKLFLEYLSANAILVAVLHFALWLASLVWLIANDDKPIPNAPPAGIWGRTLPQRGYLTILAFATLSAYITFMGLVAILGCVQSDGLKAVVLGRCP